MSDEQQQPEWGAETPKPASTWTAKKTIAAAVIAVGITAAGGVAIYAASGSTAATQAGGPGRYGQGPGGPGGRGMGGFGTVLPSNVLHGEFQVGEVTEVSASSIAVKSTDGYTKTYTIDAETVTSGVQTGDTVTVIASGTDAQSVVERGMPPNGTPK